MEQTTRIPTKDEIIVRQSQLQRAIEIYTLTGQVPSVQEVCRLSQILTEFIFTWDEKSEPIKKFDNHIKEKLKKDLVTDLTKVK
jgi:tRNA A37 N6-isopentenylltransferase MiaA